MRVALSESSKSVLYYAQDINSFFSQKNKFHVFKLLPENEGAHSAQVSVSDTVHYSTSINSLPHFLLLNFLLKLLRCSNT